MRGGDDRADCGGTERPSLFGRAWSTGRGSITLRLRSRASLLDRAEAWLTPVRLAILVPALTLGSGVASAVGAQLLADWHRRATVALAPRAAPVLAAERAATARAEALESERPAFARRTISATLEGLARDLPGNARVEFVDQRVDGRMQLAILVADPDALRGIPALAGFRQLDQRSAPVGGMRVLLEKNSR